MITRAIRLSGLLAIGMLSIGCQAAAVTRLTKEQAIARASQEAKQSAPEVGIRQARIDSVVAELITLADADRRMRAQRGSGGYATGQSAQSPAWWVAVRGYFQYEGMGAPPNPAPICEADERDFIYDAQTGESIGERMPNTRCPQQVAPVLAMITPVATPTSTGIPPDMDFHKETFSSPDGKWLARETDALPKAGGTVTGENYYTRLEVARTDGTRVWKAVDTWSHFGLGYTIPRPFHWSKDGRYLFFTNMPVPDGCALFVNGSDLQRLDLADGSVIQILPTGSWWISISPHEDLVASIRRGAQALEIVRHDLRTTAEQSTDLFVKGEGLQAGDIVWSPDGTAFMLTIAIRPCAGKWAEATSVVRVDATSLAQTLLIDADKRLFSTIEWSTPDRAVLRDGNDKRWWLDVVTGQLTDQ